MARAPSGVETRPPPLDKDGYFAGEGPRPPSSSNLLTDEPLSAVVDAVVDRRGRRIGRDVGTGGEHVALLFS